jgi:hypothetical protein
MTTATARAVTPDDEGPDLDGGHSPALTTRDQAAYEDGLESLIRTIRLAPAELKEAVIRNAASECAGYVRSGFSKQIVVDRLCAEPVPTGLNIEDLIDGHTTMTTNTVTTTTAMTAEDTAQTTKPLDQTRLRPILWSDLDKLPKREALVEGLLDCAALSVVFGPSGCGKTFFALDLVAHIAVGRPWRDRTVLKGAVVYVAAEGGHGILDRLTAFRCQYGTDPRNVPLYVIPEPIDLCNSEEDVDLLIARLHDLPNLQPVRVLVIDTVSRALAGGNENTPDHMGALVKHCDKLRAATGAHVMLLHHTGKDTSQGARGHSLLRAAVDIEIEIKWDKEEQSGCANVTKQRDTRTEGKFEFKLADVDVDQRPDGTPIASCVVVPLDNRSRNTQRDDLTPAERIALNALTKAIDEKGQTAADQNGIPTGAKVVSVECWREYADQAGISSKGDDARRMAFKRAEKRLTGDRVGRSGDLVWLKIDHHHGEHTNTL